MSIEQEYQGQSGGPSTPEGPEILEETVSESETVPEVEPEMAKDLGEFIRLVRLKRGVSIPAASEALNIRRDYLVAIEENRWTHLPGSVYTIGFLKAYAAYLNINPMGAVEAYKTQSEQSGELQETLILPTPIPPHGVPTRLIFGGAFLVLLLILVGWMWLHDSEPRDETLIVDDVGDVNAIPLAYPLEDPIMPEMTPEK